MSEKTYVHRSKNLVITSSDSKVVLWSGSIRQFHLLRAMIGRELNCTNYANFVESTADRQSHQVKCKELDSHDGVGMTTQFNYLLKQINQPLEIPNEVVKEISDLVHRDSKVALIFYQSDSGGMWTSGECGQINEILLRIKWNDEIDKGNQIRGLIRGLNYCLQHDLKAHFQLTSS